MPATELARIERNAPGLNGLGSVITTVYGSGAWTALATLRSSIPVWVMSHDAGSLGRLTTRWIESRTSSAVSGFPLENTIPRFRWKVYVRASWLTSHDCATSGRGWVRFPRGKVTRL